MVRLLDLPMRDGNFNLVLQQRLCLLLLDLPMRDGNPSERGFPHPRIPSFRPSYEGWKLKTMHPEKYKQVFF